ncbi:hypothetical protein BGZ82_004798 [Podila clonocystis]|nr:hypothetical protein BGZ82_004798 [Podila clonocystis]
MPSTKPILTSYSPTSSLPAPPTSSPSSTAASSLAPSPRGTPTPASRSSTASPAPLPPSTLTPTPPRSASSPSSSSSMSCSRRGAAWTWLAGFVCTAVGGIGVYVPLMFVPLLNHHRTPVESSSRANAVPLPRVYAFAGRTGDQCRCPDPGICSPSGRKLPGPSCRGLGPLRSFGMVPQQQDLRARRVLVRVFYLLAGLNAGVHVASLLMFWHKASSAYYLLWDTIGAAWGALLWIVADSGNWLEALLILVLAPAVSPVSAMMVYAARRKDRFLERLPARRYDGKAKLQ